MSAFPARFAGRCASCDSRIHVGDLIEMTDDGAVHASCDEADIQPSDDPARACPTCWLVHPEGACDR